MLQTKIIKFSLDQSDLAGIQQAVEILRTGGLVAFPTETVYGLGADALNTNAVKKIFEAKGRPIDNPLIIHIASVENVQQFASSISEKGMRLARRFWPGPLTLVVQRKKAVPDVVTAGLDTVALRIPHHAVALELLKQFQGGIVGPSANISGKPSPTSAEHVFQDLQGRIDLILDAGSTRIGVESTVVDVTVDPPAILRIGGLSKEEIEKEIGEIQRTKTAELLHRSPGTRYRHYAPHAQVILFPKSDAIQLKQLMQTYREQDKKIGFITYSQNLTDIASSSMHIQILPSLEQITRNLFRALRELDHQGADVILVESVEEIGLGAAVMDRLQKASAQGV
jgi:L-threonylcarbamoyladenylate synthase